ncbi:unnamed protein product [Symbiodinium natans]|uniref:Uncharacterized protein n=1 Tax=Symbiodinium natans TaxID=878477 RepID=A0A812KHF7_9DINO|nr:unnamed protein product [Symbiodinium natans]
MKLWLHIVHFVGAISTQLRHNVGHWKCPADTGACYCQCGSVALAAAGASLAQIIGDVPIPPLPPVALPPFPPARLPAMATFTSVTEDDLPTLGPPPATTPLPTLPPTVPPTAAYPFSVQAQANMLRGNAGSGSYGLESSTTSAAPQEDSVKQALVQESLKEGVACHCQE